MRVAVLLPGFIKSYAHLEQVFSIFQNNDPFEFYFFGCVFDYIIPLNMHKHKITYVAENFVDKEFLATKFTNIQYVDNSTYKAYDADGYDNRIISQWINLKQCFDMAEQYSVEKNMPFDLVVRCRTDLFLKKHIVVSWLHESFLTKKIIFGQKALNVNDQFYLGPFDSMKKIMGLRDKYYEYLSLPEMILKSKNRKNMLNRNRYLRFENESEVLLWHHIQHVLLQSEYCKKQKFWKIKRD